MSRSSRSPFAMTCRAAALLALFFLPAIAPAVRAEITPDAAKVVDKYLNAVGGAQAVRSVTSTHSKDTIEAFGLKGSAESWSKGPASAASLTSIGPITVRSGFDGAKGWRTDPTGKVMMLDGKDLEDAQSEAYFTNDRWLMADQGGGKVALVQDADAPKTDVVLEVTPPVGRSRRMWFDRESGLLEKEVEKHDTQTVMVTYSDYRAIPGATGAKPRLAPWTMLQQVASMPANSVTAHVDSIELNVPIDDGVFAPPAAQGPPVSYLKQPGVARVPFEYLARHVWVRASVNGQPPADFIYDTGASITVIDSAYAAKIGLERQGSMQGQGASAAGAASLSSIQSLRLSAPDGDGLEMKDQKVAILSVNPFLAPAFWRDCAGIVGYDFISRFVNEIDYDARVITFRDPATFKYEGKGAAIPMQLAGTVPAVKMTLDDQYDGVFRLDVGSNSTVDLHTPFVNAHNLREKAKPAVEASGGGFGGMFTSTITRMKKITIGPYSWADPIVSLSSTTEGALASEDYAGNVGNHILERFKFTIDYDHKTVYLEPGKNFDTRDVFTRSGAQLAKYGDTVKASQVLKDSPSAKAGIQQGDQVLSIDGKAVASLTPEDVRTMLDERPAGSKVTFEIVRDGKKSKKTVKLADLL